jgi:hypothetical protein
MALTKKHLEAFAAALRTVRDEQNHGPAGDAMWHATATRVADVCARFNHGFDRARFLKACGVDEPAHTPTERHKCDNCGKVWSDTEIVEEIENLNERLDYPIDDPRCVVPSGECPDCGALCYPYAGEPNITWKKK